MAIQLKTYLGPYIECKRDKCSISIYDIIDESLRRTSFNGPHYYLIPNVSRIGEPPDRSMRDDGAPIDMQNTNIEAECEWLRDAFAVEIAALEKAYGKAEIRWGLCQWWA
jgi:hypothetical protein